MTVDKFNSLYNALELRIEKKDRHIFGCFSAEVLPPVKQINAKKEKCLTCENSIWINDEKRALINIYESVEFYCQECALKEMKGKYEFVNRVNDGQ